MNVEGRCHCGAITFKATIDPDRATLCHCTDCHFTSGSGFSFGVPVVNGAFEITTGTPAVYIKKTADSGSHRAHGFCPICGTRLYASSVDKDPAQMSVRVGTLKQQRDIAPKRQLWCASAFDWAVIPGVNRLEKQ